MDVYAEVERVRYIPSDSEYLAERKALIEIIGERAYLAISDDIGKRNHAKRMAAR